MMNEPAASFDLLRTVEYGGCSAKLPADVLAQALASLPRPCDENLMVDISTHDDAGVYRISEDTALIQTTDFFPPICSNPYLFGKIAAANALSDVYAMGGRVLTAMNLVMFPSQTLPLAVLREILRGGQEKVAEAGGVLVGGHTIEDSPPKYGLAVTGVVHPQRVIRNDRAQVGDVLLLTKPLGVGVLVAGQRCGVACEQDYQAALDGMEQLNRTAAEVMQTFHVRCATDITGFGLLGHLLHMARGSGVSMEVDGNALPRLPGAYELLDMGCIPGAAFRNLKHVEGACCFDAALDPNLKMLSVDPQTSGGILMCVPRREAPAVLHELHQLGCGHAAAVGRVVASQAARLVVG